MSHNCKEMKRDAEFRTPVGQAAWSFYKLWMTANRKKTPHSSTFLTSYYYTAFIKFSKFVHATKIPDVDSYIRIMSTDDIAPTLWTMDQAYQLYINWMDRKELPQKHAAITVETLFQLCDEYEIEHVGDIFDHVEPNDIIQLLRQRRLSPWILLKSSKFKHFFVDVCSNEERLIMETIIRPKYWGTKFAENPDEVARMKTYVAELSL